jgi:hypothetical protein
MEESDLVYGWPQWARAKHMGHDDDDDDELVSHGINTHVGDRKTT